MTRAQEAAPSRVGPLCHLCGNVVLRCRTFKLWKWHRVHSSVCPRTSCTPSSARTWRPLSGTGWPFAVARIIRATKVIRARDTRGQFKGVTCAMCILRLRCTETVWSTHAPKHIGQSRVRPESHLLSRYFCEGKHGPSVPPFSEHTSRHAVLGHQFRLSSPNTQPCNDMTRLDVEPQKHT